ncbi:hypothetical protein ARMSODRAFT_1005222 [Armillaria solidipes]|uniref:Uncharacterized protein n=1 Tax=Armillaria solidipes TaxID=1076256 RepID=A0A2H3BT92_9AGAR|nr:hypothetical protein ARMSODRAFT_1005222 [Armillaria solidipes]
MDRLRLRHVLDCGQARLAKVTHLPVVTPPRSAGDLSRVWRAHLSECADNDKRLVKARSLVRNSGDAETRDLSDEHLDDIAGKLYSPSRIHAFIAVFLKATSCTVTDTGCYGVYALASAAECDSGVNCNDWYLGCRPARRCAYGNVDDAVEELDGLGVAEFELELEVDFVVELDVMVTLAEEGGCTSPVNASALILSIGAQQVELAGHLRRGPLSKLGACDYYAKGEAVWEVVAALMEWEEEITHVASILSWGVCVIVAVLVVGIDIYPRALVFGLKDIGTRLSAG